MAYKVGDKVTIKKNWDPGYGPDDYQLSFLSEMLEYGGKIVTISKVVSCPKDTSCEYPSDGYYYNVKEDGETYNWTIGMFKSSEKAIIKIKKHPIKLNYSL